MIYFLKYYCSFKIFVCTLFFNCGKMRYVESFSDTFLGQNGESIKLPKVSPRR